MSKYDEVWSGCYISDGGSTVPSPVYNVSLIFTSNCSQCLCQCENVPKGSTISKMSLHSTVDVVKFQNFSFVTPAATSAQLQLHMTTPLHYYCDYLQQLLQLTVSYINFDIRVLEIEDL